MLLLGLQWGSGGWALGLLWRTQGPAGARWAKEKGKVSGPMGREAG